MKNKHTHYTYIALLTATLTLSLTSCVKDDLYNTPHPDQGAGIILVDWSAIGIEAALPESYTLRIGTEEYTVGGSTNQLQPLLQPGRYELTIHNSPEGIAVVGNTARVNSVEGRTRATEEYINPLPNYLFSAHQVFDVMADDTIRVTAQVKQLVRLLEVELSVTEGDYSRVQSAMATLDGIASEVDIVTGERAVVAKVQNDLAADGDRFATSFRLLGTLPSTGHTLTVSLLFTNGDTKRIESDVTTLLTGFNDRTEPMKITGDLLLPVKAGVTDATITDWKEADGVDVDAD